MRTLPLDSLPRLIAGLGHSGSPASTGERLSVSCGLIPVEEAGRARLLIADCQDQACGVTSLAFRNTSSEEQAGDLAMVFSFSDS